MMKQKRKQSPSAKNVVMLIFLTLSGCMPLVSYSAEVIKGKDPETGLLSWTWHDQGISIQLVQRLPDQTRAFFLGRGFAAEAADRVGRACVFQTIFRNDGNHPIAYDLANWSVYHEGTRLPLSTREVWAGEWKALGIDQASTIAFYWSLLPSVQRFEPGDYNWGMTSFGLPPGEAFDLSLVIEVNGESVVGEIEAVVCAVDP